jgi:hypothetical protein
MDNLYEQMLDEIGVPSGAIEWLPQAPRQPTRVRDLPTRDQVRMDDYNKRYDYGARLTEDQQLSLMSPLYDHRMENRTHQYARDAQVRQLAQQQQQNKAIRADVTPQQFSSSMGMTERSIPRNARAAAEHRYGPWNEGKTWGRVGKPYAAPQQTTTLGGREVPMTKPSPNAMVHHIPGTQQNRAAVATARAEQAAMQRRNNAGLRAAINSVTR